MKRRKLAALVAVLTCFVVLFAACEPVNGLDIDRVLETNSSLGSVEGKSTVQVELLAGDSAFELMMSDPALLALSQGASLNMNWKQEDYDTISITGDLSVAGQTIPAALYMDAQDMIFNVEGIERPLVIYSPYAELAEMDSLVEHLTDPVANKQVTEAIVKYLLFNLPNPETIDVERATITVNDQRLNVRHIHAEVYGDEILDLLQVYLSQLADDEEGLREALSELYDYMLPVLDAAIEQDTFMDDRTVQWIQAYLHNKTLVTEFLYTTVTEGLDYALDEYDEFAEELLAAAGEFDLLTDATYIKVDTYINSKYEIVQTDMEIMLAVGGPTEELEGIKITSSDQYWNHNGQVVAEKLSGDNGIDLSNPYAGEAILSSVDADSVIGQLLTATGMNKKEVYIWLDDGDAYSENGTTMYPAYMLRNQLGLELEWSWDENQSITLSDYASGTTVTMTEGESVMYVNGEAQEIPAAPVEDAYQFFVPVRPIAEAFGYEVSWDPEFNTIDLVKTYF